MNRSKIVLVTLLMVSVACSLWAQEETWGQWTWKWGTRAVMGVVAVGVAVTTLPVTGPATVCLTVAAGSGGVAGAALMQGDEKAAKTFAKVAIGGGVGIIAAPAAVVVAEPLVGATLANVAGAAAGAHAVKTIAEEKTVGDAVEKGGSLAVKKVVGGKLWDVFVKWWNK